MVPSAKTGGTLVPFATSYGDSGSRIELFSNSLAKGAVELDLSPFFGGQIRR